MVFHTGVDTPPCRRLKSTMQRATETFDKKALRGLKLTPSSPASSRRPKRLPCGGAPPPLPATAAAATTAPSSRPSARPSTAAKQTIPANPLAVTPVTTVPANGYFGSPESASKGRLTTLPVTNRAYSNPDLDTYGSDIASLRDGDTAFGGIPGSGMSLSGGGLGGVLKKPRESQGLTAPLGVTFSRLRVPSVTTGLRDSESGFDGLVGGIPVVGSQIETTNPSTDGSGFSFYNGTKPSVAVASRPMESWLQDSTYLTKQAEGHITYTYDLRKKNTNQNRHTDEVSKKTRVATNTELRNKVRDVQRIKSRVEDSLNKSQSEYEIMGQVRQFIIEVKAMVESGPLAGSEMRIGLRESRPQSERTSDIAGACLADEHRHHLHATNAVSQIIEESNEHLESLGKTISDLYDDLEEKVEGLRIDEQCLVLDGSSSINPQMGGSAQDQPPLELMLDGRAKEVIQGLGPHPANPPVTRAPTQLLIERAKHLVTQALSLRGRWRKVLTSLDTEGRALNKKVDQALRHKAILGRKVLSNIEHKISALLEERARLEGQMHCVKSGLEHKNTEKDIVCKRLRLRCQIPGRDVDDKVHEALEKEYDFLTLAVQEHTSKLSQITLEISRMHDTKKTLEEDLSAKRAALNLDEKCLSLPFVHKFPFPTQLYNGVCSGHCAVYGCAPSEPPAEQLRSKRNLVNKLQGKQWDAEMPAIHVTASSEAG